MTEIFKSIRYRTNPLYLILFIYYELGQKKVQATEVYKKNNQGGTIMKILTYTEFLRTPNGTVFKVVSPNDTPLMDKVWIFQVDFWYW